MRTQFAHNLGVVTAIHTVILCALATTAVLPGCRHRKPIVLPVELVLQAPAVVPSPVANMSTPPEPTPEPPAPEPAIQEAPVPPEPKHAIPPPKKETPKPPKKAVIKPAPAKKPPTPPKPKPISAQDIARDLSAGMKPSTSALTVSSKGTGPESVADADAIFWTAFQQAFYNAWLQPSYADVGNAAATIRVRLGTGGYVSDPVLTTSSGNEKMDASAMQAAQSVTYIPGLPAEFVSAHKTITIVFKVENEGAVP